jgi:hypothetical protein
VDVRLFIIGTSHTIQCGIEGADASKSKAAFAAELRRVCEYHRIERIAEEMSTAGLKYQGVKRTVGAQVARKLGIEHHHVDMEPKERAALSLDDGPMLNIVLNRGFPDGGGTFRSAFDALGDAVRERCWIGRILARREWPTLFVCGSDHTASVARLWRSLKLPLVIVHPDYEP